MQPITLSFFLRAIDTWDIRVGLRAGDEKSDFWFPEEHKLDFVGLGDWQYYSIPVTELWGTELSWDRIVFQVNHDGLDFEKQ